MARGTRAVADLLRRLAEGLFATTRSAESPYGLWGIHLCERMRAERAAELADLRQTIARLEGQLAAMTALLGVKADAFGDLKGEKGEPGPRRTSATRTSLRRFKLRRRCGAPAGADHTGARSRRVSRRHILSVISPSQCTRRKLTARRLIRHGQDHLNSEIQASAPRTAAIASVSVRPLSQSRDPACPSCGGVSTTRHIHSRSDFHAIRSALCSFSISANGKTTLKARKDLTYTPPPH